MPYNFMVTKDWMMMVIRSRPDYDGKIHLNSLGYLGLLWAQNEEQKRLIQEKEVIKLLHHLSVDMHSSAGLRKLHVSSSDERNNNF